MAFQFVTDLEGPLTLDDNAFELTREFLPKGEIFFSQVSRFDDYLSDIEDRPGYQAGDTLKLILPFLRGRGLTNEKMEAYAQDRVTLLPHAASTLKSISRIMPTFIISTSYEAYVKAFCEKARFPVEHAYFTRLTPDAPLSRSDAERLEKLSTEIVDLPALEFPSGVRTFGDLASDVQATVRRLNQIFFSELPKMRIGALLMAVKPIGAKEKVEALQNSLKRTGNALADTVYVGDSITDQRALETVRNAGGVTISFNGNRYAVSAAEFACIASDTLILYELADAFSRGGKEQVEILFSAKRRGEASASGPYLAGITDSNRQQLINESELFRKELRGRAGRLG